ncbi:hypothetical protein PGT21_013494 [Puccinia graminis f. sp. tritici]|uniref:Uncharacterized protein n=1 Tax=Puccinia graminis f. sp. tritici TaxID=56615 RepID=A0A5B0M0Y7_PUCGR|nr:hypothetical protein PGT21_013494 [Puccinia graminis f. sp. tritici]KAA1089912.1 hypothetical protein PGTUg99_029410 [Puccinia graminis f. sp. tritici]
MRTHKPCLAILGFVCFLSSSHSLHIGRLQSRSLHNANTALSDSEPLGEAMKNALQRQPATLTTGESKLLAPDTQRSGGHSQPVSSEATREGLVPESHPPEPELTKFGKIKNKVMDSYQAFKTKPQFLAGLVKPFENLQKAKEARAQRTTAQRMENFIQTRNQLSKALVENEKSNGENNLDLDKLAAQLEQKLSKAKPFKSDDNASPFTKAYLDDYLKKLKSHQTIVNQLKNVQKRWSSTEIISPDLTSTELALQSEILSFIREVSEIGFQNRFWEDLHLIQVSINPEFEKWPAESFGYLRQHIPNLTKDYLRNEISSHPRKFVAARARQLKGMPLEELPANSYLTVEQVIERLPSDLSDAEMEMVMYRYAVIKKFEALLQKIRKEATSLLEERLKLSVQPGSPKDANHQLKKLFSSPTKEDLMWLDQAFEKLYGTSPATVYVKLRGIPEDQILMRSVLDNNVESLAFLSEDKMEALRKASSDRQTFQKKLKSISSKLPPGTEKEAIETVRKEATIPYPAVERPIVDKLHSQHIISDELKAKLNPPGGLSLEKYLKALGTQDELRKTLMSKFQSDLRKRLEAPQDDPKQILDRTVTLLAQSHIDQLDIKARIEYKPDSLLSRKRPDFRTALGFYDPAKLTHLADGPQEPAILAKAYVEAHLPLTPSAEYVSDLDELLSEVKIPQIAPDAKFSDDLGFTDRLALFDQRLSAIYLEPFTEDDPRLSGTQYQRLTKESRESLNNLVHTIYSNRRKFDAISQEERLLSGQIEKIEAELAPQLPVVTKVMKATLKPEKPFKRLAKDFFSKKLYTPILRFLKKLMKTAKSKLQKAT